MPDSVSVAISELAGAMREGLLAFAVGAGLQVMGAPMDSWVAALAWPERHARSGPGAVRHGRETVAVVLGGRQLPCVAHGFAPWTGRERWRCRPMSCSLQGAAR